MCRKFETFSLEWTPTKYALLFISSYVCGLRYMYGEWTQVNFINLNRLFECFFIASGFKANLCKSTVFGVGVDNMDIATFASILNCEPTSFLFAYLCLAIGVNMKLTRNQIIIVDKFKSRLSS